jgi:hypothetical protein
MNKIPEDKESRSDEDVVMLLQAQLGGTGVPLDGKTES